MDLTAHVSERNETIIDWFHGWLWVNGRRAGREKKTVRTTHHTDKMWLYILLEQTFLIIYRMGVKSNCGISFFILTDYIGVPSNLSEIRG